MLQYMFFLTYINKQAQDVHLGLDTLLRLLTLTINVKITQQREKYFYFIDVLNLVLLHLFIILTLYYKFQI